MPATSAASLRRKAAGIAPPPPNPMRQEQGRKGRAKQLGKNEKAARAGRSHSGVKGGRAVATQVLQNATSLRAKLLEVQTDNRRLRAIAAAQDVAEDAVAYLGRLVRGQELDATHRDRITASRVVLDVARVTGQVSTDQHDESELHEMPRSALMALLGDLQAQAQQVVIEGEVIPADVPAESSQ